jgi:hypothetical protein
MKTREDKKMVKLFFFFCFFKTILLGLYRKQINTFSFWSMVTSLSTFGLHLVRGPKALQKCFLKNSDHGGWIMKSDQEKGHWSMV